MKRLLLAIGLVLVMAIPGFAQNGPINVRSLMIFTKDFQDPYVFTPYFHVYQTIVVTTDWEVKGAGYMVERLEVRDAAGVLIKKIKTWFHYIDNPRFTPTGSSFDFVATVAGILTVKVVYVDATTGNTWSHQTKVHVSAPL